MSRVPVAVLSVTVPFFLLVSAGTAVAQVPETFTNLQVLPKTMPRQAVLQRMREFSFALGVRCQHCHAGGDGVSFDGVGFSVDDKPAKRTARAMMQMVQTINASIATGRPGQTSGPARVDCVTCHRGRAVPGTLSQQMARLVASDGVAAAIAHYRQMRTEVTTTGGVEFGQWQMNELARELAEGGQRDAAIEVLELNAEFYATSADIDLQLGDLYLDAGKRDSAKEAYARALQKAPNSTRARERLQKLGQ